MGLLESRRTQTQERIEALRARLVEADRLCAGKACVYMTGSFARGEATVHSDLDLFIVGKSTVTSVDERRLLRRLEEIRIKADLIEAVSDLEIPEFSGDGKYLEHYTTHQLIDTMGTPEDDAENTFTARLLLLLESRPLLGEQIYQSVIEEVIGAYWEEYVDHKKDFMPAFLANDILRLWRTFCVNYEARTLKEPDREKAKRKIKNYKLGHSRLLTCFSAILYLLAVFVEKKTVDTTDAAQMISLTPTQRIEWLLQNQALAHAHDKVVNLLRTYESFLQKTEPSESELLEILLHKEQAKEYLKDTHALGDTIYELLHAIGSKNPFYRFLVV
jgi:predicted nucleotidyltransferase